jgi:hypothetical protein
MSDEDSIRRAVAVGLPVIDAKLQRLDAATLDAAYGEEDGGQEEDEFDAVTCFQLDPCFWEPQHFINKTLILEHDIECDLRLASESGRLSVSWKLQPFNYPSDLWLGFRFLREGNLVRRWFLLGSSGEGQASIEEEMLNVEHKIESFVLVAAYLSSSQRSRIQLGSLVELRPLSLRLVHGDWSAPLVRRAAGVSADTLPKEIRVPKDWMGEELLLCTERKALDPDKIRWLIWPDNKDISMECRIRLSTGPILSFPSVTCTSPAVLSDENLKMAESFEIVSIQK